MPSGGGGGGGGGAGNLFQSKTYFAECRMDLPREAIGPESAGCRDAKLYEPWHVISNNMAF